MSESKGKFSFNTFETINKKQQEMLESIPDPEVQYADMPKGLQEYALERGKLAYLGLKKGDISYWKDVCQIIKRDFDSNEDKTGGGTWHCIAGTHFGSFSSYESQKLILFNIGSMKVLLYKHG